MRGPGGRGEATVAITPFVKKGEPRTHCARSTDSKLGLPGIPNSKGRKLTRAYHQAPNLAWKHPYQGRTYLKA